MKYDLQLSTVKSLLPTATNILIALPTNSDLDKLAAGLALFLALEAAGKQVSIVCDDTIRVNQAHLFGIDHVKNTLPQSNAGNLVVTLEGVAAVNGTIPALEKLDWFAENNNLNLVFHVLPGQTFQPVRITPKYQTGGFNLVFSIGASNLNSLGNIYLQNQQTFSGIHVVNIDNLSTNENFGQSNIVDNQASSVSEIVGNVILDLGFVMDADTATDLLAGIFDATKNLTDPKVNADTYMAIANCMRVGGKKSEGVGALNAQSAIFQQDQFTTPQLPYQPQIPAQSEYNPQPDLATLNPQETALNASPTSSISPMDFAMPAVASDNNAYSSQSANQPSQEEKPAGEGVISETVEPDWLTPKIFKGTSLG